MHIALTPAEAATAIIVGAPVPVHSRGRVYQGVVLAITDMRAQVQFFTGVGTKYENWLTIPGRGAKDRQDQDQAKRQAGILRGQATKMEKNADRQQAEAYWQRNLAAALEGRAMAKLARTEAGRAALLAAHPKRFQYEHDANFVKVCLQKDEPTLWARVQAGAVSVMEAMLWFRACTQMRYVLAWHEGQAATRAEIAALRAQADALAGAAR